MYKRAAMIPSKKSPNKFGGMMAVIVMMSLLFLASAYAASKGADPVAQWRFDEGGGPTAYDESTNNNDGTLTPGAGGSNTAAGQMWSRQGKIGGALELDGTDDYVSVASAISFGTGNFTVCGWVKIPASKASYGTMFSNYSPGGIIFYSTDSRPGGVKATVEAVGLFSGYIATTSNTNDDVWHHLAFVREGGTCKIYFDGKQENTKTNTASDVGTGNANPRMGYATHTAGEAHSGLIDDVKVYNYARTPEQILVDYNAGSAAHLGAGTDANEGTAPVGYWPLDENTGTTTYDRSGNGNNGTITGAAWAQGKNGQALSFNGSSNNVSAGTLTGLYSSALTVEAWVNHTSSAGWDDIVAGGCGDILFGFNSDVLSFGGQCNSPFNPIVYSTNLNGAWHHVAGVYSGTTAKLYVDGIEVASSAKSGSFTPTPLYIASSGASEYFTGKIDDVRIYNYSRSAAQIAYDYNRGKPIAHYKFDEPGGVIAHNEASLPSVEPHRYWRFIQTAVLTSHAPRTCELRWTDTLGNTRTPDSYTHGGAFSYSEELWNTSFDNATNTSDAGWITGDTGYIAADFGTAGVSMMKFEAYASFITAARGATWDIQYSDDNSNWTTIKTWSFQTTDNGGGLGAGNYAGWYNTTWHTHGTLVGDAKFADGKIGKALEFDGNGDYVSVPNLDYNIFTFETWVKRDRISAAGLDRLLLSVNNGGWGVYFDTGNTIDLTRVGISNTASSGTITDTTNWHHVAVAYNGSNASFYIDGKLDSSPAYSTTFDSSGGNYTIGSRGTSEYLDGKLDDVRVYNYARTAEQVLQDYNAGNAARLGAQGSGVSDPWGGALPVAYWKLDENTGVLAKDASGNGNNGTITGASWTQGKNGPALSFDGSDDLTSSSDSSLPIGSSARTFEMWIYPKEFKNYQAILFYGTQATGNGILFSTGGATEGTNKLLLGRYGGNSEASTSVLTLNVWQHIALSVDGSGNVNFYINGVNAGTTTIAGMNTVLGGTCKIGDAWNTNDNFNGYIDDVKIYNYARSAAQVAWDYNHGKPLAHWRMDENTGTTVYDDSGNGRNGSFGNTPTWVTGKFGSALEFNGTNQFVGFGNHFNETPGIKYTMTAEAWFKADTTSGDRCIFTKRQYSVDNAMFGLQIDNGSIFFRAHDDSNAGYDESTSFTDTTSWHHIAGVWDNGSQKLYLDGVLKSSTSRGFTKLNDSTGGVYIGAVDSGVQGYFDGKIDDARVYNYARTAEQVLQDYLNGSSARLGD